MKRAESRTGPERLLLARRGLAAAVATALLAGACATVPTGPSMMVLPGSGKTFDQFMTDDALCRQWAGQQTGAAPAQASTESGVTGAAVGTAVGAAAGAAIGAAAGSPATGAAAGAGAGLLGGTAIGIGAGQSTGASLQWRYDMAFMQCMYAKGHQIPMPAGSQPTYTSPPPPPASTSLPRGVPPPPPGPPPPPPPQAAPTR